MDQLVETIQNDHERGASELARQALLGLARQARSRPVPSRSGMLALGAALRDCRPAMAPIHNLLQRWLDRMAAHDREDDGDWLTMAANEAETLSDMSATAVQRIAQLACRHIPSCWTLMTHSFSSTVLALAEHRHRRQCRGQWLISRSDPQQEGLRLADALAALEQTVLVFTEAQAGLIMRDADLLVVGADSLLLNGDLINKVGTSLLALAAADQNVPLLCLCESFKYSDRDSFDPEPRSLDCLHLPASPMISGYNFTFDRTPAKRVSAVIHEGGLVTNPQAQVPWHAAYNL